MTPYAEAIETKLAALRESHAAKRRGFEDAHEHRRLFGDFERMALRRAHCYYWTRQITDAVMASSLVLPDDTAISLTQYPDMDFHWFWFERPITVGIFKPFQGILWGAVRDAKRSISLHTYGREFGQIQVQDSLHLPDLYTLRQAVSETDIPDQDAKALGYDGFSAPEHMNGLLRFFVSALLWIEQEIVVSTSHPADRHARKRITAERPEQPTDIKVIELRRKRHEHGDTHDPNHVEWSCQWIVRGHWRQQFYPSTGERRPLWILPYVKGPEDRPLKAPQAEVFAVRR